MRINKFAATALVGASLIAGSANAIPLTLDAGFTQFSFQDVGSSLPDFTFTTTATSYFVVTDAFCAGDRFSLTVDGDTEGLTSLVAVDAECSPSVNDPEAAIASGLFSAGEIELAAGSYTVSGTVVASPFAAGAAFAQLSSTSVLPAVPLPASALLLLSGVAGAFGLRRKKKSS